MEPPPPAVEQPLPVEEPRLRDAPAGAACVRAAPAGGAARARPASRRTAACAPAAAASTARAAASTGAARPPAAAEPALRAARRSRRHGGVRPVRRDRRALQRPARLRRAATARRALRPPAPPGLGHGVHGAARPVRRRQSAGGEPAAALARTRDPRGRRGDRPLVPAVAVPAVQGRRRARRSRSRSRAGASVGEIADILHERGVISSAFFFRARATVSGQRGDLKPGTFELRQDMSYGAALDSLTQGPPQNIVKLTIPEGRSRTEARRHRRRPAAGQLHRADEGSRRSSTRAATAARARRTSKVSCSRPPTR